MSHTRYDILEINQALINAGLDANEARAYRALLTLGQTGASALVRETGMHGQMVYRALERLIEKGYVTRASINNRWRFSARSPMRILEDFDSRREQLSSTLHLLEDTHAAPLLDQVEVVQGKEQFIRREVELLKSIPAKGTVQVISGVGDKYEAFMGSHLMRYDTLRRKRAIKLQIIGCEETRRTFTLSDRYGVNYRLLPHAFYGNLNLGIYGNVFGIYIFTEPVTSILVHNKTIAENFRQFFDALWKMGR